MLATDALSKYGALENACNEPWHAVSGAAQIGETVLGQACSQNKKYKGHAHINKLHKHSIVEV